MKKMLAIATIAALLGGGSAFAAESAPVRLDDAQMDGLTAGKSGGGGNNVIIVPITNIDLTQLGVAIGDGTTVTNNAVITVINNIVVIQQLGNGNGKFKLPKTNNGKHYGHRKGSNSGPG